MGNCQAIDAATLVIQHPTGKVEKMYWPVPASDIMKLNPGHYVALLITTTICHTTPKADAKSPTKTTTTKTTSNSPKKSSNSPKNSSNSPKGSSSSKNRSSSKNSSSKGAVDSKNSSTGTADDRNTVRITRVKLLRPTDTLALGHVYRLISTQEVMKGLVAKKQAKLRKNGIELADSEGLKEAEISARRSKQQEKTHQVSRHGHRSRTASASAANGVAAKSKTWQPSLHSISEAAS